MTEWFNLPPEERIIIINQVSEQTGLIPVAIEKDLWVMIALRAIFNTEIGKHLVFKGGTSLSKAWRIIERFSEDIDLSIDRSFFDFNGNLNRTQIKNLRKASCKYINEEFQHLLADKLKEQGVKEFEISILEFEESDTDPIAIELRYKSLIEKQDYLPPRILIEISSRSLKEPYENRALKSLIGEMYPDADFADKSINIPTVLPTRTLLEKIFLLHEEFQKPKGKKINSHRMTRHLYDISKLMDTEFLEKAINDNELYQTIISHRSILTRISWIDYKTHQYKTVNFIPPKSEIEEWKKDYQAMRESMFYGETESFENLIKKITRLNEKINLIE